MSLINRAGFAIPKDLESLYDRQTWEDVKAEGLLERRNIMSAVSEDLIMSAVSKDLNLEVVSGGKQTQNKIHDDWRIYIEYKFSDSGKKYASEFYSDKRRVSDENVSGKTFVFEKAS